MSRFRIGQDGKTPEQRRARCKWKRPMVTFGETVFFRPIVTRVRTGGEDRMNREVFVGHHERTGASMFRTPVGLR
eukprot:15382221-Heterocapsa_arctica.AAC.1